MTPGSDTSRTGMANLTIKGDHFEMNARVPVPLGPTRVGELLPLARGLADEVVRAACRSVEDAGAKVSCQAGCGACCRNLVMISQIEARRLRVVVEDLPEPRRTEIRTRFAGALQRFRSAGLLDALQRSEQWTAQEYTATARRYFEQGVACPFLEAESCSIHAERPITCREYLVTSPPEHCARADSTEVRRVTLPLRIFNAVARWQTPPGRHLNERAVPLVLALEWADAHADDPPAQPGPQLLRELLDLIGDKPKLQRAPS